MIVMLMKTKLQLLKVGLVWNDLKWMLYLTMEMIMVTLTECFLHEAEINYVAHFLRSSDSWSYGPSKL